MSELERQRDALRASIEDEEQRLKQAVGRLKTSIKEEVSVASHAGRRPYAALGVALALGFALGAWHGPASLSLPELS
jgi:ElaB/YqjD/DUF883 family membrane-anchored ribosome-binding protein